MVLDLEVHLLCLLPSQTSTICSISEMSSKYVRYDAILPSRKSATVAPGNLTCRPRRLQFGILAENQWPRVIGFDQPLGVCLIAHFVQPSEEHDDVGECDITEGSEDRERSEPDTDA